MGRLKNYFEAKEQSRNFPEPPDDIQQEEGQERIFEHLEIEYGIQEGPASLGEDAPGGFIDWEAVGDAAGMIFGGVGSFVGGAADLLGPVFSPDIKPLDIEALKPEPQAPNYTPIIVAGILAAVVIFSVSRK